MPWVSFGDAVTVGLQTKSRWIGASRLAISLEGDFVVHVRRHGLLDDGGLFDRHAAKNCAAGSAGVPSLVNLWPPLHLIRTPRIRPALLLSVSPPTIICRGLLCV